MQITPPRDLDELQARVQELSGQSINQLATKLGLNIPQNRKHAKGWAGQVIELALGATGGSAAELDFKELGVELKTIPINERGLPLESTYLCTVTDRNLRESWQQSWPRRKLAHVLWLPIQADRICPGLSWQLSDEIDSILEQDYEELMELLALGHGTSLSARFGTYLHIRPKAANSRIQSDYQDQDGYQGKLVPRGFYLRTAFTKRVLGCKGS